MALKKIDYTKFSLNGQAPKDDPAPKGPSRWWAAANTDTEAAQGVASSVSTIAANQGGREAQTIRSARLYGNISLVGGAGMAQPKTATETSWTKERLTLNVIQSCVDTLTSKIAKSRPKPLFLTSGGNYRQKRRAKKLNKFVDGIFYENSYYKLAPEIFRDAAVTGTGVIHVFPQHGRVAFERVLGSELYVDEQEALLGHPRQLHRVKAVDRHKLMEEFPEHAQAIAAENQTVPTNSAGKPSVSDMVTVRESWHLPSGPEAEDGLHLITMGDQVILRETWSKSFFPFAFFHFNKRMYGFWGQGLAEQLESIQREINRLLFTIQRSLQLAGSFKIFLAMGSKVNPSSITNEVGQIIHYQGERPDYVTPPVVPPELYGQLERLVQKAYEMSGISQLSATSQKPAGLNSGKALREVTDIESDRFQTVGQAYENLALDVARLSVDTVKDIAAHQKTQGKRTRYQVSVPGKKTLSKIDWKDVAMDESDYVTQVYPVSSLPTDPAGRLQTIQEYIQAGFLTPRQGRRLLDFPDLDAVEGLANAAEEYLECILDRIVDDGEFTAPEPYDDLQTAREMALEFYADGKANGLEEEKLELLRRFLDALDALNQPQQPEAAEPGGSPQGGPPQGAPQAPPTSDLMPFAGA